MYGLTVNLLLSGEKEICLRYTSLTKRALQHEAVMTSRESYITNNYFYKDRWQKSAVQLSSDLFFSWPTHFCRGVELYCVQSSIC